MSATPSKWGRCLCVRRYFSRAHSSTMPSSCSRPRISNVSRRPSFVAPPEAEARCLSENLLLGELPEKAQDDCRPVGVLRTLFRALFLCLLFISQNLQGKAAHEADAHLLIAPFIGVECRPCEDVLPRRLRPAGRTATDIWCSKSRNPRPVVRSGSISTCSFSSRASAAACFTRCSSLTTQG